MFRASRAYGRRIYHNSGKVKCNICATFSRLTFGAFLERKEREGMLPVWKCCQLPIPIANWKLGTGHWIPATLATFVARARRGLCVRNRPVESVAEPPWAPVRALGGPVRRRGRAEPGDGEGEGAVGEGHQGAEAAHPDAPHEDAREERAGARPGPADGGVGRKLHGAGF